MKKEIWLIMQCMDLHTFAMNRKEVNDLDIEKLRCPVCDKTIEGIVDRTVLIANNPEAEIVLDNFHETLSNANN